MFTGDKVGDLMKIAMRRGRRRSGSARAAGPVASRSRSSEQAGHRLALHLSAHFYRDEAADRLEQHRVSRTSAMPHALWELQGEQVVEAKAKSEGPGYMRA